MQRIATTQDGIWYLNDTDGCCSFLCPPGHANHKYSIVLKSKNGRELLGFFAISTIAYGEICGMPVPKAVQQKAQKILKTTRYYFTLEWCHQVLRYFRDCYSPDGIDADVNHCIIDSTRDPIEHQDCHLGVMHIRKYFPDYKPTVRDFANSLK